MAEIKVLYDETGNTLTVWFGDPADEYVCEETGDEILLMKDKNGRVIGFEKLNYVPERPVGFQVGFHPSATMPSPQHGPERGRV